MHVVRSVLNRGPSRAVRGLGERDRLVLVGSSVVGRLLRAEAVGGRLDGWGGERCTCKWTKILSISMVTGGTGFVVFLGVEWKRGRMQAQVR